MVPLTLAEASDRIGLSTGRLRQVIAEGRLRATMIGRTWTVSERDLERFASIERRPGRPSRPVSGSPARRSSRSRQMRLPLGSE